MNPSLSNTYSLKRRGFTLIELLVVIAIIAILAVVVVLVLNPGQLLAQSRDANRVSDLATLTSAMGVYITDQSMVGLSLGSSSVAYPSLPDPTATTTAGSNCGTLGLPSLSGGWNYQCAGPNYYRSTNDTGWIPINFQNISSGAPFGSLPVDPTNQTSSGLYYTYETNGSQYEFTAGMESKKYQQGGSNDVVSTDGGQYNDLYEKGTNLALAPIDFYANSTGGVPTNGLVGYWPLNEGSGSTAIDASGNGYNGTWNGTQTGTSGYYSSGYNQTWAGTFDGVSDYINTGNNAPLITGAFTSAAWVKSNNFANWEDIVDKGSQYLRNSEIALSQTTGAPYVSFTQSGSYKSCIATGSYSTGIWYFVVGTYDGSNERIYVNGVLSNTCAVTGNQDTSSDARIIGEIAGMDYFSGLIENVRIYNRALSAAEIQTIYNAGK